MSEQQPYQRMLNGFARLLKGVIWAFALLGAYVVLATMFGESGGAAILALLVVALLISEWRRRRAVTSTPAQAPR